MAATTERGYGRGMLILYIAGGVLLGLILFTRILGAAAGPTDDELVHDAVKRSLERD